jgi:hypothetical protein
MHKTLTNLGASIQQASRRCRSFCQSSTVAHIEGSDGYAAALINVFAEMFLESE